ncbi:MAG: cyclic pyranopterin monophosphate synthase MoaC [Candidatus Dormibacteria bacterium]
MSTGRSGAPEAAALKPSHLDAEGRARMVDVSAKAATLRQARATGFVRAAGATLDAVAGGSLAKGDALAVARIAGIMAAKRTAELIPLCHPLSLTHVDVEIALEREPGSGFRIHAEARCAGPTGVEMEALTAVSVAALALVDMCKGLQRDLVVEQVRLVSKSGGRSGDWNAG